ncbi:TonB-dependent receptor domain-containing protein [Lonsdalea quercina]|uniref:TonB-dependent receptor domain-containing protein n=1 Tax=Lonsdalea quercina TaxID=71657 RepID=UPI00047EBECC|nr:TonB-dependent receptor [Lonsdalea quercina]
MFLHTKEKHLSGLIRIILTGVLTSTACNAMAALSDSDNQTQAAKKEQTTSATQAAAATAAKPEDDNPGEQMTVISAPVDTKAGSRVTLDASEVQKNGGNDFGTIMRYQPLVSATSASSGSGNGKSGFDRSGYTGYNIRGLESNRVAIDVDGIPLPNATARSYAGRAGLNTFGIGRDYIDPYMYGLVIIDQGATSVERANNAIGGAVSFRPKSPDQYLSPSKHTYFGYQSDYDSSNRSWHNGITAAGGDETLRGIVVISRRDGQETQNNSGVLSAYPMNWHSTSVMTSGIWQANDQNRFTGTLEYYTKTSHSNYDSWDATGSSILGNAQQDSDTRRWSSSLRHNWTASSVDSWIDAIDSRIYYQNTKTQDETYMPLTASSMYTVNSDYKVDTYGAETTMMKTWGMHQFSWGFNAQQSDTKRPFTQDPAQTTYYAIMQPEADSRTDTLGGFVQDRMEMDVAGRTLAITPGVRVAYQRTKPQNLSSLTENSSVLTEDEVAKLYGTNSDTQVLPSLSLEYALTPRLTSYIQYKRGAQFPDASQLYGSWGLGSSYAGASQYALIGNNELKTETSNNYELGLKGEMTEGVTFRSALFYNTYKNFIAYTRYTRANNPDKFSNVPSNINIAYQSENRDKAFIYGAEFSSKVQWGTWFDALQGLSTTLGVGYSEGQSKSSYSGDKYVDLDSVAPLKAVVGLGWDAPDNLYGAALTATFQKGKQATATNRETYSNTGTTITDSTTEYMRVPGYGLVDLTAYWRVTPTVKLSGGVYNLTDRKYWDYLSSRQLTSTNNQDAYDQQLAVMPGRTFQLGINVDF